MGFSVTAFSTKQKYFFAYLTYFLIPISGMSTDIYLPSLPAMTHYFHTTASSVQLTVSSYVLAMGIFQLVAGPISDARGRKKIILISLAIQFVTILAVLLSSSVLWIIAFRFIQGAAVAFMVVPARAILNDIFSGDELRKKFNYLTISYACGPIVAPFIGGYLQHYFNWQASFVFILIAIVILFTLMLLFYRETLQTKRQFLFSHLWKNYTILLTSKQFVSILLLVGLLSGFLALFNVSAPFLVQVTFHQSAIVYGHIALLMGAGWMIGNISNRLLFHYSHHIKTTLSLFFNCLAVMIMLVISYHGGIGMPLLVVPSFVVIVMSGFVFPIYVSKGLMMFTDLAASANACMFSFTWMAWALFTFIVVLCHIQSLLSLAMAYTLVAIVNSIIYVMLLRPGKA